MATRLPNDYDTRREALATYFDSTARQAWIDLTSDTKVSGIRATVRAGRDAMRATLLDWLPTDLRRTTLVVRDIERSLPLYRDALGLPELPGRISRFPVHGSGWARGRSCTSSPLKGVRPLFVD